MAILVISYMLLLLFYSTTSDTSNRIEMKMDSPEDCEDILINQFLEDSRTTIKPTTTTTKSFLDQYPVVNQWPRLKMYPKKSELLKEIRQKTQIDGARRGSNQDCGGECGNSS